MAVDNSEDVGDQVIDQYIEELKKTKADPNKKTEFMNEFARRASSNTPEASKKTIDDDDPLKRVSVQAPSRDNEGIGLITSKEKAAEEDIETPTRRVIPKGEYKPQSTDAENTDTSNETVVKKLEKLGVQFPEELDRDALDDAQRLSLILIDNKIKGTKYIVENYVKRTYPSSRRAADKLNELMRDVAIPERTRRIVLTTYYDSLSKRALDSIFAVEEEDDEVGEVSSGARKPRDGSQIVKVALRDKNGKPIIDAEGHPVTKEVTKDDLYYALQMSQMGGSGSSDYMELIMNLQDKRHQETMGYFKDQVEFWKRMSASDPVKRLVEQKQELLQLGLVSDGEKPSDYQTKVIKEAREAGKEVFRETKDELKSIITMFRDDVIKPALMKKEGVESDSGPKKIESFKDENDQENAFDILNEAVEHEEHQLQKKDNDNK